MTIKKFPTIPLTLAVLILLASVNYAQIPPPDQRPLPQLPQPRELLLNLDLKVNNGASSTNNRAITLNFTAIEKSNPGNLTVRDETSHITHYRVLEDSSPESLSEQTWIPITRRPPFFNLAERNRQGQRYGERRVVFQVKTDTLTSNVVSDTIVVEPLLKEYKVSASSNAHPLIQYAAQQGFTFPLNYYETCKGNCPVGTGVADGSLSTGTAKFSTQGLSKTDDNSLICVIVSVASLGTLSCHLPLDSAPQPAGTCTTKADYLLFEGRSPNQFWHIKSVAVDGARVVFHGANRFLVKFNFDNKDATCFPPSQITIGDVVVEGPVEDDFVDAANPWKNAFVRQIAIKLQQSPGQIITPPRVPRP